MKNYNYLLSIIIGISSFNLHAADIKSQDRILIYSYAHIDKNNSYQAYKDLTTSSDEAITYKVPSLNLSGGRIVPSTISAQTSCFIEPDGKYFNPQTFPSNDISKVNRVVITPKVLEIRDIVINGDIKYANLHDFNTQVSENQIVDYKLICVKFNSKSRALEYTLDTSEIQTALKINDSSGTLKVIAEFLEQSKYDNKIINDILNRRDDKTFSNPNQNGPLSNFAPYFFKNLYL
ncbi:MAG: hypothetical protein J0M15_16165 [Deltaproteobacteria bacterium]|nr:hypothetical protein [Deltaproteobacteria bacterium]